MSKSKEPSKLFYKKLKANKGNLIKIRGELRQYNEFPHAKVEETITLLIEAHYVKEDQLLSNLRRADFRSKNASEDSSRVFATLLLEEEIRYGWLGYSDIEF